MLISTANPNSFTAPTNDPDVVHHSDDEACHLLCFLSKDLLGDFEACAEIFIPVLFKLVVITVLVIAESVDNCIKTMLQNCKVSRILPRIADCAKNDHSAALCARCCDYLLMILEHWVNAPEIQQSAGLYEDFIICCVADATSEVRSIARQCYKMFTKTWPERSKRMFLSFDPVIQRVINDEDDGVHRRHATALVRYGDMHERTASQTHVVKRLPGCGIQSEMKSFGNGTDQNLESMLNASNQKVTAIESILNGLDISEKHTFADQHSSLLFAVAFGQHFCLHFEAFQLGMAPVYMEFLRFIGDYMEARNYSYSLEVRGNGRKLIWEGTPQSVSDSHQKHGSLFLWRR